jgi:fructoselysine-6-P-deglycase FrlB-like protein
VITLDPALFTADLEAKPATLRALADRLAAEDPWAFLGPVRRVTFLGMGSSRYAA